jgi:SET domain-containing protein
MSLAIRKGTHGRGVFTDAPIAAGTHIMPFTGPLLHYADTNAETYALQIGPDLYIGESGGFDDIFNHSCEPNAGIRIEGTRVDLWAIRDIAPEEEICFDYSTTLDEDDFTMPCQCGTPSCRKLIRDGKYLPEDTWQRYLSLGILPEYVRAHRSLLGGGNPR